MNEKILLVIEDESKFYPPFTAHGSSDSTPYIHRRGPDIGEISRYDLFFTNFRIIAAVVVSTYDLPPLIMSYEDAKPTREWKRIRDERRQQFKKSTPDEILHIHPESFDIRNEDIEEIKLEKSIRKGKLIVKTKINKKHDEKVFPIPKNRYDELEELIQKKYSI